VVPPLNTSPLPRANRHHRVAAQDAIFSGRTLLAKHLACWGDIHNVMTKTSSYT
jgi:hypothetical protein